MSTSEELTSLRGAVVGSLSSGVYGEAELDQRIAALTPILAPQATAEELGVIRRELVQQLEIVVDLGSAITSSEFKPWLEAKRGEIDWCRWRAYKQMLLQEGRPPKVMNTMGELTDDLLDLVGDPTVGGVWGRRGLVIGDVQSGKTGTYLGLFNKAADAGYRLIIVLAGSTESLRQQTQSRVDAAFIGRDSSLQATKQSTKPTQVQTRFIGIGQIDRTIANAQGMTTVAQDFRNSSLLASSITVSNNSPAPYVFVLKKNKHVLTTVQEWLHRQAGPSGKIELPLLLLDDEADYASVNTSADESPTAINAAIRKVLDTFERSSYVAFTATPFANILIDHESDDDLFPRDYVYSLEAPSNYVGAATVFGTADDVRTTHLIDLSDAKDFVPLKHKSQHSVEALPPSLLEAVRAYLLATTIRDMRGEGGGRSMLVNVSRFKRVQGQVHELISDYVARVKNAAEMHGAIFEPGGRNAHLQDLHDTFTKIYPDSGADANEVISNLWTSIADVTVELINGDRDKRMMEKEKFERTSPRMIAVGGDVLSRGLTLDGLSTTYFYRRAGAFDTLLQMGRWFGYRDAYQDLTRIWITDEVADQFRFVDDAVRELREDLADMRAQRLTPADFGLAVKKHPDSLMVTARNKMRDATTFYKSISLGGRRIETVRLSSDPDHLARNLDAFTTLLRSMDTDSVPANTAGWPKWTNVPKKVVATYLLSLHVDEGEAIWQAGNLQNFVATAKSPSMQSWDVVVAQGRRSGESTKVDQFEFVPPERTMSVADDGLLRVSGASARLAGSPDVEGLVDAEKRPSLAEEFRKRQEQSDKPSKSVPETYFYAGLDRPTLLIYPLRAKFKEQGDIPESLASDEAPLVIATKIMIPGRHTDVKDKSTEAQYVINTVAQQAWLTGLEWGEEDD